MPTPYVLSTTLVGHTSDVKSLSFSKNLLYTVSRDCTLRKWVRDQGKDYSGTTVFESSKYLNAVAANEEYVVAGGLDTTISGFSSPIASATAAAVEPTSYLLAHEGNVCALDIVGNTVVSGSWDNTAKIWSLGSSRDQSSVCVASLKHSLAVWAVCIFDDTHLITACADKSVNVWSRTTGKLVKTLHGHEDAVRSICKISDDLFATSSNDSTIRVWSLSTGKCTKVLKGHHAFVYSVDYHNGLLASCGEEDSVKLWDLSKPESSCCVQELDLPCVSLWTLKFNRANGDLAIGGSDGFIRIFTQDDSRKATESELESIEEALKDAGVVKTDDQELSDASVLRNPAEEGKVVMVKNSNGTIEAHQFSGGNWLRIGEVVGHKSGGGGPAGSNSRTRTRARPKTAQYNGKAYDFVFDVDVEDGQPPLKLPYNNEDNPYTAAEKFLADNELPSSYLENVVRFIITNAEPIELSQQGGNSSDSYAGETGSSSSAATTAAPSNLKIIPHSSFIELVSYNPVPILVQLEKMNSVESSKLSATEIETIKLGLETGITASNSSAILKSVVFMTQNWSLNSMLVALDILRIVIPKVLPLPTAVVTQTVFSCLDIDVPKHCLLAIRTLVNLFSSEEGRKLVLSAQVEEHTLGVLKELTEQAQSGKALSANYQVAISSLLLNYAVLIKTSSDRALGLLSISSSCAQVFSDSEAQYRLLLAIGTVIANNRSEEITQAVVAFDLDQFFCKEFTEPRTVDLLAEISIVM